MGSDDFPGLWDEAESILRGRVRWFCKDLLETGWVVDWNTSLFKSMIESKKTSEAAAMPDIGAVENPSGGTRLLKAKQALLGFANGSNIAAMADTGSRKNVMSESYAKNMGLTIKGSSSTFEIGNSRKIRSIGRSRCRDLQRSSLANVLIRDCVCSLGFCRRSADDFFDPLSCHTALHI